MALRTRGRDAADAAPVFDQDYRPPPWRERLVPKTVLGISMLILAAAVGSAFSGTVLYAYYDYRLSANEDRIQSFTGTFDQRFQTAMDTIDAEKESAKNEVKAELEPLKKVAAEGGTMEALVKKVQPSVWFVSTLDEAGQPSVGSAFVVASDNEQSLMLASFNTVRAATRTPGPPIKIRKGDQELPATLWTWQEEKDLALLIVKKGGLPKLEFAGKEPVVKTGERVFAASGLGAAGGSVTQGFVADISSAGIQHDAAVGPAFQGGPLLNSEGKVLAVSSRAYAPLNFSTDAVFFGVPIRTACEKVLKCPDGGNPAAGNKG